MTIKEWPASKNPPDLPGMLVKVSHAEALALIRSLAAQMVEGSANAGRHEGTATRGNETIYFSVSVMPQQTERVGNA